MIRVTPCDKCHSEYDNKRKMNRSPTLPLQIRFSVGEAGVGWGGVRRAGDAYFFLWPDFIFTD